MEELVKAAILGIVQGLTEFLPISSTGHLILVSDVLGIDDEKFGLQFDATIHLGTLAAVLVYFRGTVLRLTVAWLRSLRARDWQHSRESRLAWLLVIGTIPAALAGIALESAAEDAFRSPELVAAMLILFCAPLLLAERFGSQQRVLSLVSPRDAVITGAAQAVALIPGVSRAGITISAGMFAGFRRDEAATFAFLLSVPIIAAAGGKQLFDAARESGETSSAGLDVYVVGLVTAAVVGYGAVALLLRFLRGNPLHAFVIYRVGLGLTVLGLVAVGVL